MNLMRRFAAWSACALLGFLLPTSITSAQDGPALWAVRDADSTLYLFGTVHALRPSVVWRTPRIEAALKASSELKVEVVDIDGEEAAIAPLVQRYGLDPANPLSKRLSPDDQKRLAAAVAAIGGQPQSLEPLRPWLAAVTLQIAPLVRAGYDPQAGVDRLLIRWAKENDRRISAFETMEQQLRFFADLPPQAELQLLTEALDDFAEAPTLLDEVSDAWAKGDVEAIDRLIVRDMKTEAPLLHQRLIVDRNQAWAEEIVRLLQGSGVTFIAVGAGHLAGEDSVQALLQRRGVTVTRE